MEGLLDYNCGHINDIPAERDLYEKADDHTNKLWVNGINEQFIRVMRNIILRTKVDENGRYLAEFEISFVVETESSTNTWGWVDIFMKDISEEMPFTILGR